MKARQYLPVVLSPVLLASASNLNSPAHAQAAGEAPQNVLAAQIRLQGFACDKSLGAVQDRKRSKPDHPVWVLKCSNATYRVSRFPDMAAKVEPLR
jgi:hypothetical protein